jgi:TATA-box binding protein (TBP) (component of TFIID and TFIIIB)
MNDADISDNLKIVLKNNASSSLLFQKMPEEVNISTMTITCNIATVFNIDNIARYVDLKFNRIEAVAHGDINDPATNRSLHPKKNAVKNKKTKKVFYNQVSLHVRVRGKLKPVNVKLFHNGSIQMTGCKTIDNALDALETSFYELRMNVKAIPDYSTLKIIEKPFAVDLTKMTLSHINAFKVEMINSNFKMPFHIDRPKLYNLLQEYSIECIYDPVGHACVNIKWNCSDKLISIFVFEKGAIIITGAKNCNHILSAYMFINKFLMKNYKYIVKNDTLTNSNILDYMEATTIDSKRDTSNDFTVVGGKRINCSTN